MTSDCNVGLTCDQSVCRIPIAGSCVNREDMCADSGSCVKGMCQPQVVTTPGVASSVVIQPAIRVVPLSRIKTISPAAKTPIPKTPMVPRTPLPEIKGAPSPVAEILTKLETPKVVIIEDDDYNPDAFHSLAIQNGKVVVHDKNIVDASFGKEGYIWYITTNKAKDKSIITVVDGYGISNQAYITGDNIAMSCQAFNKICYVLVKNSKGVFSMQKFTLRNNNMGLGVEYPHFPVHDHVVKCINLGISATGLIMIVTSQSNISFNPNSVKDNVSSWFVDVKDNKDVLFSSHVNGKLFSLTDSFWIYGDSIGAREEDTFPVVEGDSVENKHYWVRDGLYLSD